MQIRALRFHGPADLRAESIELPEPHHNEVVVRVEACGVCGSDLHFLDGSARTGRLPVTLGHEIAGRVAESRHPDWTEGDAVLVAAGVPCGVCPRCREDRQMICERLSMTGIDFDGGLADELLVPGATLLPRPASVPPQIGATAVDAGATAYHAVACRAGIEAGRSVLIVGIGGLGTFGVQIAKALGAAPVIAADHDPAALERVRSLGADETLLVEEGISLGRSVKLLTDGGVDAAIEFVGRATTVDACVKSLRPGGTAVAVGVGMEPLETLPPVLWATNEYALVGSFGSHRRDAETVLGWLADGTLQPPPLEVIPLHGAEEVIMALASGKRRSQGRLIVVP